VTGDPPPPREDAPAPPLAGIRVLDFGRYIAGPYCACLLGDLGADVIRVERVGGGEDRRLVPVGDAGALYLQVNRNKRSLTLDPAAAAGREIVRRLVAGSDVVVVNLPPPTRERLGLDHASLRAVHPDVILTTIDAFGGGGPWSGRPGFDGIGQAMSGAAHLSGDPDVPMKAAVTWVDFTTAALAAFGTVAALRRRDRTGEGAHVEGSLLAAALTVTNSWLIEEAVAGPARVGSGNRAQVAGPADVVATTDGWIVVQVVSDRAFARWARLVGREEWIDDSRFGDDATRGAHRDVLCDELAAWAAVRGTEEALDALAAIGVPAAPVLSPRQALDHPHIQAVGFLQPVPYPGVSGAAPVAGTPVGGLGGGIRRRAPTLGEHTDEILAELGYPDDAISRLRRDGIV